MGQDGSGWGVYGRLFDKDGLPTTGEFKMNATTSGDQSAARIAALSENKGYAVVWSNAGKWLNARTYDKAGNSTSPIVTVMQGTSLNASAAIAGLGPDKFVVTWEAKIANDRDVIIQLWQTDGTKITDPFVGAQYSQYDQTFPKPAQLANGGFEVVWQGLDFGTPGINMRAFDGAGQATSDEYIANVHTGSSQKKPHIAGLPTGGFVVAWAGAGEGDGDAIWFRIFSGSDTAATNDIKANVYTQDTQAEPVVEAFPDGSFIIGWVSKFQDGSVLGVYAQRFDKFGNKLYD